MPSDFMSSDQFIKPDQLISASITVARVSNTNNVGSRMWFAISDTDGMIYQKWSLMMDNADVVLMLTQPGDRLDVEYWVEHVSDPVYKRIPNEITRNNLVTVKVSS